PPKRRLAACKSPRHHLGAGDFYVCPQPPRTDGTTRLCTRKGVALSDQLAPARYSFTSRIRSPSALKSAGRACLRRGQGFPSCQAAVISLTSRPVQAVRPEGVTGLGAVKGRNEPSMLETKRGGAAGPAAA